MKRAWMVLLPLLAGCGEDANGPAVVHWDRDVCERCRMMISDRRFPAQLRDAQGKPHLFDDFGDMVMWLKERDLLSAPLTLYVADMESGAWLDAHTARYTGGYHTPMGFGCGARAKAAPGDMDFARAVELIVTTGKCGGTGNP